MEELIRWWKSRTPHERNGILVLLLIGALFVTYRLLYEPRKTALGSFIDRQQSLENAIDDLNKTLVGLDAESAEWDRFAEETELVQKEVQRLEGEVIGPEEVNTLLSLMASYGQGLGLEFHTIKQRTSAQSSLYPDVPYSEIAVEVLFRSDYAGLVNYLKRIESLSPLLKVSELEVVEPKHATGPFRETLLTLTLPVLRSPKTDKSKLPAAEKPALAQIPRSLFGDVTPKTSSDELKAILVTGITIASGGKTAIINNEVLRVGDPIDAFVIEDIFPDKVILSDGTESHPVMLQ